ncbi:MAG TPA: GTP pyrophosphokinase family protein [Clostridiales bacterium]|nr:GTP pyrophosphokinase family protein [Clostridiales bacterium]
MDLPMFYDEAEDWSKALLLYDAALKEVNTKLEILNNEFKAAHQYNPIEHITSRIKTPQSIAKKLRHNQKELTIENIVKYVNDVAGIRIICSFTSDIYRIADLIAKQNDIKVLKVKDYIMCPKENGYTSYHMIIAIPVYLSDRTIETKVEIQIRTIAMDFWASLEHKIYYKFEGNAPENIRKELKECSEIVAYLDQKMLSLNEEIKNYTKANMEAGQQQITTTYQSVVTESFGTIVEEEEITLGQQVVGQPEFTLSEENVASEVVSEQLEEDKEAKEGNKGKKKTSREKPGRKRMIFGIRA